MSGFLGLGGSNASTPGAILGYRVQTSILGKSLTILIGTGRLSGNVIWVGDWDSNAGGAGGKGVLGKGSGGGKGSGQFNYSASFILALCQGQVLGQQCVTTLGGWSNNSTFAQISANQLESIFAFGTRGQPVWSFLISNHPSQALGYSEICYCGFEKIPLGTSAVIPNYTFEVQGPCCYTPLGWLDALVTDAIYAILADFNMMNFSGLAAPFQPIGDMTQAHIYCLALGLNVSVVIDNQNTAQTTLQEILLVCNSEAYSSEGLIKVATYGDKAATGPSYTPAAGWGSGASGTVVLGGGGVVSVTMSNVPGGGSGYVAGDTGTINGGSGTAAYTVLTVGPIGNVLTVSASGGTGYAGDLSNATTTVTGTGTGLVIFVGATLALGAVAQATVYIGSGSGYLVAPAVTFTGGTGSGAAGYALLQCGVQGVGVAAVVITSPGAYTVAPTVVFTPPSGSSAVTFTPDLTPVYTLDYDAFVVQGNNANPITFTIEPAQDANNNISFEWTNRAREYNLETVIDEDSDAVNKYGRNIATVQTIHSVANASVANQVASVQLKRSIYYLRKCQFTLGWAYSILEPMDIVTVPEQYPSSDTVGVRLLRITEDEKGNFACEGEVLPFPILNPSLYAKQISGGYTPGVGANPGNTNPPIFFELPPQMSNAITPTHLILSIALSGGPGWGGTPVYVSTDGGVSYNLAPNGQQTAASNMGFLTASYGYGSDPDTIDLLQVNLQPSYGEVGDSSQATADGFTTLILIDQELVAYAYSTLTGANEYSFENGSSQIYMRRGVFGSNEIPHANGALCTLIGDGNQFLFEYSPQEIGLTYYFKFPAFNKAGQQIQSLASATAYPWTLQAPYVRPPIQWKPGLIVSDNSFVFGDNPGSQFYLQAGDTVNNTAPGLVNIFGVLAPNQLSPILKAPVINTTGVPTPATGSHPATPAGTFIVALLSIDTNGLVSPMSNIAEVLIPTTGKWTVDITVESYDSASVNFFGVIGLSYDSLYAYDLLQSPSSTFTFFYPQPVPVGAAPPPDPRFASLFVQAKPVIFPGSVLAILSDVSASTVTITPLIGSFTANQFAGCIMLNYSKRNSGSGINPIYATISANTTSGVITVGSPTTWGWGVGNLVVIRTLADTHTASSIGCASLVNANNPAGLGASDAQFGNIVRIIGGTGQGQVRQIAASTATGVTPNADFSPAPDNTSIFVIEVPTWTLSASTTEGPLSTYLGSVNTPALCGQVDATALGGQVVLLQATAQDENGVMATGSLATLGDCYIPQQPSSSYVPGFYLATAGLNGIVSIDLVNGLTQQIELTGTTLASGISAGATSLSVNTTVVDNTACPFQFTFGEGDPNPEVCICTAISGSTWTISAAQFDHASAANINTPLTISNPTFTGGSIAASMQINLLFDQDSVGGRPVPQFETGFPSSTQSQIGSTWQPTANTTTSVTFSYRGSNWPILGQPSSGGSLT